MLESTPLNKSGFFKFSTYQQIAINIVRAITTCDI